MVSFAIDVHHMLIYIYVLGQEVKHRSPWWLWAVYGSPTHWTLWGAVSSQLGDFDSEFITDNSGVRVSVAEFVRSYFGFHHSWLGYSVLFLIGFILLFRVMSVWALCCLIFLKS